MPLAEGLGEFVLKVMSVRQTDIGGGQIKLEVDLAGEVKGEISGQSFGTLTVITSDPNRPAPWTYVGSTLTTSGSIVRVSGQGLSIRTGEGHKVRYRGTGSNMTDDSKLSAMNNVLFAVEAEADPATLTLKGATCVWK
jgi:hypothetical protein